MKKKLQTKSFTGLVSKFHSKVITAKMVPTVQEWVEVFKTHVIRGLEDRLKDDGVLLI